MKQVKEFARIFQFENGQILVTKGIDTAEEHPYFIEAKTVYENKEVYITPSTRAHYSDSVSRDSAFDEFESHAEKFYAGFDELIKESFPNAEN